MKGLSHRKPKRVLVDRIVERDLKKNSEIDVLVLQKPFNHFSAESSKSNKNTEYFAQDIKRAPEKNAEDYESIGDSKYGFIFAAEETELGQNPDDNALDFITSEDLLVMNALNEETGTSHYISMEDVLDEMGYHIEDPDYETEREGLAAIAE